MKTRHQNKRSRQEAEEHPKRAEGSPPAQGSRDKKLSSSSSRQQQQQAPQKKEDKRATRQQKGKAKTGSTSAGPAAPAAPVPPPPHQQQQQQPQPPTKRQRRSGRREASAPDPPAPQQPPSEPAPLPVPPAPPAAPTAPAAAAGGSSQPPSRPSAVEMAGRPPRGMDDDDEMAGNMNSASTALQGLLRKLGAGFDDIMGMGMASGSRFKAILSSLRQADDESAQVGALTELCEVLSISSEDTLASFPIESSVPMLVQCLSADHNPDMMLLAARALTFMADVLPVSCGAIVRHGAVPAFCQRLLTIEYIDLAEQSLQALEKLSHDHSHALLQNGGLLAVLSYLDFFPTGVQRVAVTTAANMCRGLTPDSLDMVQEAVPLLTNLLQYQDAKIVDKACVCLGHIAEVFGNNASLLGVLNSSGLVVQALQLIKVTSTGSGCSQLSIGTYYCLVRLLATCVASSPVVSRQLIEGGVLDTVRKLLSTSSILPSSGGGGGSSSVSMLRTADQLYEVLSLLGHLLPAVPESPRVVADQLPALQSYEAAAVKTEEEDAAARSGGGSGANSRGGRGSGGRGSNGGGGSRSINLSGLVSGTGGGPAAAAAAVSGGGEKGAKERAQYLQEHEDVMRMLCKELLPLLLQLYAATVMPQVRYQCLSTIIRLLAVLPSNLLEEGLHDVPVSSFVASLLVARDSSAVAYGLHAAELLMLKLPQLFHAHFLKEGVVHALQQLAARTLKEDNSSKSQEDNSQQGVKQQAQAGGAVVKTEGDAGGNPEGAQGDNNNCHSDGSKNGDDSRGNSRGSGEWKSATRSSSRLNSSRKSGSQVSGGAPPPQASQQQQQQQQQGAGGGGGGGAAAATTASTPSDALASLRAQRGSAAAPGGAGPGSNGAGQQGGSGGPGLAGATAAASAAAAALTGRGSAAALRTAITLRARKFLAEHLGEGANLTPQGIADLRALCDQLDKDPSAMRRLFEVLSTEGASTQQPQQQSGGGISVFELLHSGAVKRLGSYLQALDIPEGPKRQEVLLERLRDFAEMALSSEEAKGAPGASLAALIHKLQAALAFTEAFPVLCSRVASAPPPGSSLSRYGPGAMGGSGRFGGMMGGARGGLGSSTAGLGGGAGSLSSGLSALTQPFKLRMCRHPSETSLREYSANVVLIEPLASMTAIEDFLWPRVHRPAGPSGGGPGLAGSAAAAAAAGAARASRLAGAGAAPTTQAASAQAGSKGGAEPARPPDADGKVGEGASGGGVRGSGGAGAWGRPPAGSAAMPAPSKAQPIPGASAPGAASSRRTTRSQSRDSQSQQQPPQGAGGRRGRSSRASYEEEEEEEREGERGGSGSEGGLTAEQRMLQAMVGGDPYDDDEEEDGLDEDEDGMPHGLSDMHGGSMYGDEHGMDEDEDDDYDEEMPEDDEDEEQAMGIGSMHVHDLHVAEAGGGSTGARGNGAAAGTTTGTTTNAPPSSGGAGAGGAGSRGTGAAEGRGSDSAAPAASAAAPPLGRPNAWTAGREAAAASASGAGGGEGGGAGRGGAPASAAAVLAAAPPKLIFYLGDQPLPPSSTVFQAIQQQQSSAASSGGGARRGSGREKTGLDAEEEAEEELLAAVSGQHSRAGGPGGRRLWDGIYTLYYRTATPTDIANVSAAAASPEASNSSAAAQRASAAAIAAAAAPGATMQRADDAAAAASAAAHPQPPAAATTSTSNAAAGRGSALAPLGTVVPLHEVTIASGAAELLCASDACKEVVALLGLLEAVNRVGSRLCNAVHAEEAAAAAGGASSRVMHGGSLVPASGCGAPAGGPPAGRPTYVSVPREEFVSSKLASKLAQQLKDVLAICGGGLPQWCHQLVFGSRHLFPFEVRRRYFYSTAFGLGRTLQHMHALHAAELGGGAASEREAREPRVGRLQRQKVRVSRKRILESAVKVMELYAKHRAVLELEYFGEVGTGLGPTLEFYTLLSHDLQRRSLNMWRHEDAERLDGSAEQGKAKSVDAMDVDRPEPLAGEAPAASSAEHTQQRADAAWHDSSPEYVNAPWGLFPLPLPPSQRTPDSKVLEYFRLLGRSLGKALQDNRLMDLPFNYTFYRALLGRPLDLYDIARFDPQLGSQLERLWAALMAHRHARSAAGVSPSTGCKSSSTMRRSGSGGKARSSKDGSDAAAAEEALGPVRIDGVAVDDLCLTFTLPGQPDYELIPNGADMMVDSSNLGAWIDAVVDATLGSGVASQLAACSQGFNEVFALSSLACFYEDEIETLLCGAGEHWTTQTLLEAIKFDHGYTSSSPVVLSFLEVLSELDLLDQRRFLRFVTGCPRLPPGGLASLQPRLTVVRKQPSRVDSAPQGNTPVGSFKDGGVPPGCGTVLADGDLPSVMTCANYIKLPPYSSKTVMRNRLLFAVREGQGSFDLS
uniref:HECT-type E3 ubiquitin transferase n=1 Tax=Dunaliella tertiolecta TaxID=3047 RepID=A0A7S3VMY1_DUNTE|eukprot:CAMPEP_0202375324 /NCGR_PEP_ID=MMETSP1127-20130417/6019_1 /ASSEMBLY_ACC=CAM_ASM_000462 /TAXON_ID=3047 /ORGANISM="Dunaliella tertiolecta, Strain CCMP1320" /LENGTH=2383 /DNA_ID=CAMNT_0048972765 /DNA_START=45 /DNA_END=7196 /DNA_ORIENTATION=-